MNVLFWWGLGLIVYTLGVLLYRMRNQLKSAFRSLMYPNQRGFVKYMPIIFAMGIFTLLMVISLRLFDKHKITYENPEFIGIAKVDKVNHRYKLCNILTGDCLVVDTCDSKVEWYAGHVMSKWVFINTGNCQLTNLQDVPYRLVRQDPKSKDYVDWKKLHGDLTYDDGASRPVIANNCHNVKNDTDTECDGGEAIFTKDQVKEISYAKPAGWTRLRVFNPGQ
jgi:hypothetical protein